MLGEGVVGEGVDAWRRSRVWMGRVGGGEV